MAKYQVIFPLFLSVEYIHEWQTVCLPSAMGASLEFEIYKVYLNNILPTQCCLQQQILELLIRHICIETIKTFSDDILK